MWNVPLLFKGCSLVQTSLALHVMHRVHQVGAINNLFHIRFNKISIILAKHSMPVPKEALQFRLHFCEQSMNQRLPNNVFLIRLMVFLNAICGVYNLDSEIKSINQSISYRESNIIYSSI